MVHAFTCIYVHVHVCYVHLRVVYVHVCVFYVHFRTIQTGVWMSARASKLEVGRV